MAGRYVVLDEIASGGMARVHLARLFGGAGFDKVVAVKRLPPELSHDASRAEALVAEARHVSRIRHPNVVSVIDVLEDERGVGIVMELVHGVALTRLMQAARLEGTGAVRTLTRHVVPNTLWPLAVVVTLGTCALFGWVIRRLMSPSVRQEFA